MKRITFFAYSYLPVMGGEQIEIYLLLRSLDKFLINNNLYKVDLIVPSFADKTYCDFKNIDVHYTKFNQIKGINSFKIALEIAGILRKTKPDIVHTSSIIHGGFILYIINTFMFRFKYIISSHGVDLTVIKNIRYGKRLNPLYNILSKIIVNKEVFHQVPSQAMLEFTRAINLPDEKVRVIPNGIPEDEIGEPETRILHEEKERYGISEKDVVILTLSGFRKVKGLFFLIEAFIKVAPDFPHLKLMLASEQTGYGLEIKSLVEQAGLKNRVHFIGKIREERKKAFFKMAKMFCMPSLFESFGIALVEAMASGKICMASNAGGMKDIIEHDKSGLLFNPSSSESIAETIKYVMVNPHKHEPWQRNAIQKSQLYKMDNLLPMFLKMYKEALNA